VSNPNPETRNNKQQQKSTENNKQQQPKIKKIKLTLNTTCGHSKHQSQ
jgi:hypothetical protein